MKESEPEAIKLNVNGEDITVTAHPLKRLLDVLRDDLKLTGVKEGCGEGECGACSILLNGELVNSCIIPVGAAVGAKIETIEGYRKSKRYSVIEDSFAEESAVQCGFCTPGFVMAAEALLKHNPNPSEDEIRKGISGNLCRCTGYDPIVKGIKKASKKGNGLW